MCFVSYVSDYGRNRIPDDDWNRESFEAFKKLLEQAKEIDKKLNQPDCEEVEKQRWMKEIEERVARLERDKADKTFQWNATSAVCWCPTTTGGIVLHQPSCWKNPNTINASAGPTTIIFTSTNCTCPVGPFGVIQHMLTCPNYGRTST